MTVRTALKEIGKLFLSALAIVYFLIDAIFFWIIKFIVSLIASLPLVERIGVWIRALPPYAALAFFLIPLLILEPVKPIGAYLIASGHFYEGILIVAVGEVLKLTLVERLFHINKDKLLSISAFAWSYNLIMRWLSWLLQLQAVITARRLFQKLRASAHKFWRRLNRQAT